MSIREPDYNGNEHAGNKQGFNPAEDVPQGECQALETISLFRLGK